MTVRMLLLVATATTIACVGEPTAPAEAPSAIKTTESRWVRAIAPTSLALLEAPARVVAEEVAAGEVTVVFGARIERVHVAAGDEVERGQDVVDVVMPELNRAAASVVAIDAQLDLVTTRLHALAKLEAEKLVRGAELFELRSQRSRLVADRAQALAVIRSCGASPSRAASILRTGRLTLVAPVSGVVTKVDANLGRFAAEGDVLVAIVGAKKARVEATLGTSLPAGASLQLALANGTSYTLDPTPIASVVDPATGQTRVWLGLAEEIPLAVGLRGRLRVHPKEGTLVQVPSAALIHHDGIVQIYIVENDEPVPHPVRVVSDSGTSALVSGAIQVGALVVVDPIVEDPAP